MRIARFEFQGAVRWGFAGNGTVNITPHDAPSLMDALALDTAQLGAIEASSTESASLDDVRLLAPIPRPPQFLGIGLNYRDHAEETGLPRPGNPQSFGFLNSAITDPGAPIVLPSISDQVDWEVELGVVIGKSGKKIPLEKALDHVAGYTIINDLSARDIQISDGQFTRGKSLDTFKPMGPWITTVDELGAANNLDVNLWVNDVSKQSGNTSNLIFDVPYLIHFLSEEITLDTGAVISTGTPRGVGFARVPPEYLRAGDVVRLEISGIGTLTNPVIAPA